MYLTYSVLKNLALRWDIDSDIELVRKDCWEAVPTLIASLEADLFKIFDAKIIINSASVYVNDPVRQGATTISIGITTNAKSRTWLTIDCLPDHDRIILMPNCEPDNINLLKGYQRIIDAASDFMVEMLSIREG